MYNCHTKLFIYLGAVSFRSAFLSMHTLHSVNLKFYNLELSLVEKKHNCPYIEDKFENVPQYKRCCSFSKISISNCSAVHTYIYYYYLVEKCTNNTIVTLGPLF